MPTGQRQGGGPHETTKQKRGEAITLASPKGGCPECGTTAGLLH